MITLFYPEHKQLIEHLAQGTKPRISCCCAKIIYYIQFWQDYNISLYNNPWVSQTYTQIREDLNKEYSIHSIRGAMELLIRLGLLERSQNLRTENGRNGQIRTYQYHVYTDRIEAALKTMKNSLSLR